MEKITPNPDDAGPYDAGIGTTMPASTGTGERFVVDRLPNSFPLEQSESEWLLTLLSADELRFIFDGSNHGEISN